MRNFDNFLWKMLDVSGDIIPAICYTFALIYIADKVCDAYLKGKQQ